MTAGHIVSLVRSQGFLPLAQHERLVVADRQLLARPQDRHSIIVHRFHPESDCWVASSYIRRCVDFELNCYDIRCVAGAEMFATLELLAVWVIEVQAKALERAA